MPDTDPSLPQTADQLRAMIHGVSKQVVYPNVQIDVQKGPGDIMILIIRAPGETLTFPMSAAYMRQSGQKMTAPSIDLSPLVDEVPAPPAE